MRAKVSIVHILCSPDMGWALFSWGFQVTNKSSLISTLSMWFIPFFMLLSPVLALTVITDELWASSSCSHLDWPWDLLANERKGSGRALGGAHWPPAACIKSLKGVIVLLMVLKTSWGDLLMDVLNFNIYFIMNLKNYWFFIYGGNIKFPFKINLFFLF